MWGVGCMLLLKGLILVMCDLLILIYWVFCWMCMVLLLSCCLCRLVLVLSVLVIWVV